VRTIECQEQIVLINFSNLGKQTFAVYFPEVPRRSRGKEGSRDIMEDMVFLGALK
jgi:hypothetical protein